MGRAGTGQSAERGEPLTAAELANYEWSTAQLAAMTADTMGNGSVDSSGNESTMRDRVYR